MKEEYIFWDCEIGNQNFSPDKYKLYFKHIEHNGQIMSNIKFAEIVFQIERQNVFVFSSLAPITRNIIDPPKCQLILHTNKRKLYRDIINHKFLDNPIRVEAFNDTDKYIIYYD